MSAPKIGTDFFFLVVYWKKRSGAKCIWALRVTCTLLFWPTLLTALICIWTLLFLTDTGYREYQLNVLCSQLQDVLFKINPSSVTNNRVNNSSPTLHAAAVLEPTLLFEPERSFTLFIPLALELGWRRCIKLTIAEDLPWGSMGSGSESLIKHWGFLAKFFQSPFWTPPALRPSSQRPWNVMSWSISWLMWHMSRSWKHSYWACWDTRWRGWSHKLAFEGGGGDFF